MLRYRDGGANGVTDHGLRRYLRITGKAAVNMAAVALCVPAAAYALLLLWMALFDYDESPYWSLSIGFTVLAAGYVVFRGLCRLWGLGDSRGTDAADYRTPTPGSCRTGKGIVLHGTGTVLSVATVVFSCTLAFRILSEWSFTHANDDWERINVLAVLLTQLVVAGYCAYVVYAGWRTEECRKAKRRYLFVGAAFIPLLLCEITPYGDGFFCPDPQLFYALPQPLTLMLGTLAFIPCYPLLNIPYLIATWVLLKRMFALTQGKPAERMTGAVTN